MRDLLKSSIEAESLLASIHKISGTFEFEPEMITVPEWTAAGVWILGRSRNQYFRLEPPESVQEPIKIRYLWKFL